MKTSVALVGAWLLAGAGPGGLAACRYLAAEDTIEVSDYTAELPCTPALLWRMDRMNGWGRVSYDATQRIYTVAANLRIGCNDGTDTYFQLGRADAPDEILIVRGHVSVYPNYIKGENAAQLYSSRGAVNRLTLGSPTNPAVRATLKIASAPGQEHTLYCGGDPGLSSWGTQGGQLHIYNSTLTAALADETHAFGAMDPVQHSGPHVVMRGGVTMLNAVISWFKGVALWSARSDYVTVRDTVFEHGGSAIINSSGEWDLQGCVFRQLRTAVLDWGGPVRATMTACAFSNNLVNWKLSKPDSRLICVDCVFDDAATKRSYGAFAAQGTIAAKPPMFISRRHLVVRVLTAAGTPVTNALVRVECEKAGWEDVVFHGQSRTDAAGCTPGPESEQAILLTDLMEKATAVVGQPEITRYTYVITVNAPGFEPYISRGFRPAESWQIMDVRLNPTGRKTEQAENSQTNLIALPK